MTLSIQALSSNAGKGYSDAAFFSCKKSLYVKGAAICAGFYRDTDIPVDTSDIPAESDSDVDGLNEDQEAIPGVIFRESAQQPSKRVQQQVTSDDDNEDVDDDSDELHAESPSPAETYEIKAARQQKKSSISVNRIEVHEGDAPVPTVVREIPEVNEKGILARFLSGRNEKPADDQADDEHDMIIDALAEESDDEYQSAAPAMTADSEHNIEARLVELTEKIDMMSAQIAALTKAAARAAVYQSAGEEKPERIQQVRQPERRKNAN